MYIYKDLNFNIYTCQGLIYGGVKCVASHPLTIVKVGMVKFLHQVCRSAIASVTQSEKTNHVATALDEK